MSISEEQVKHVARLARLDLTDDEVSVFVEQLGAILARAERIQSLDLDEVEPTAHPADLINVLREDVVEPPGDASDILANAPASDQGLFVVPRVLDDA